MTEEREALNDMLKRVESLEKRAAGTKDRYLKENGVKMPYYVKMSVDGGWRELFTSYETAKIMVTMIEGLQARVEHLEKHADNLEDILQNGPGSEEPKPLETKASRPPIDGDSKWEPTELEVKQLSTDGHID